MKKLLFGISLLLMPFVVNAEVTGNTVTRVEEVPENATVEQANAIKKLIEDDLKENGSIYNVANGYYLEGISVSCKDGKQELTYINEKLSNHLTCENGNKNPYIDIVNDANYSFGVGLACDVGERENYVYATKLLQYNCLKNSDNSEYVKPSNKDDEATTSSKPTGTTENKDTGVEDYFITLGVIGVSVTVVLYILDKKNSFKKI